MNSARAARGRQLTLLGGVVLILIHGIRLGLWHPAQDTLATALIIGFLTLPVAVCLPGVWYQRSREYILLSLLSLPLFVQAALLTMNPGQRLVGVATVLAVWVMFAGTMFWLQAVPSASRAAARTPRQSQP